ncbi:MAG: thiol:disulfide interchange protein DsbA/DsbL [Casimicrobiaceae bacterium]
MAFKHRLFAPASSAWRAFGAAFLALGLVALAMPVSAQGELQEGKQYTRLKNPVPVESGGKIEVIEFFSYGCPHCAELEPILDQWLKTVPPDVQFRRVPVLFQPRWVSLARVYYTLEALGADAKLTPEVFAAVHRQGVDLASDKTFFDWAASKGLDRKKVEEMYSSFGINGKVNRAKQLGAAYDIQSVPTVIVDGKYVTGSDKVGTHAALPAAINALVAKARKERKS